MTRISAKLRVWKVWRALLAESSLTWQLPHTDYHRNHHHDHRHTDSHKNSFFLWSQNSSFRFWAIDGNLIFVFVISIIEIYLRQFGGILQSNWTNILGLFGQESPPVTRYRLSIGSEARPIPVQRHDHTSHVGNLGTFWLQQLSIAFCSIFHLESQKYWLNPTYCWTPTDISLVVIPFLVGQMRKIITEKGDNIRIQPLAHPFGPFCK